jgi:hypothetical protein
LLLAAFPVFCQAPPSHKPQELLRFTLDESPEQIAALLGRPEHIDDSTRGYKSWQYSFGPDEASDDNSPPAWLICATTGKWQVLSVTRNFDRPQDVDALFPPPRTEVHHWPSKDAPQYSVRLRPISKEVLLLAMGAAKPGERTSQLMLIRRTALKTFMPWLDEQLR